MPQVESLTNPIANLCRINCSVLPTRITPRTAVRQTQFRQSCIVATQVALSAVAVSLVEKSSNRTIGQNYRSRMRSTVECQLGWLAFATLEATSLASHATEASTCRPLRAQVLVLTARTDRTMGPSGRVFLARSEVKPPLSRCNDAFGRASLSSWHSVLSTKQKRELLFDGREWNLSGNEQLASY